MLLALALFSNPARGDLTINLVNGGGTAPTMTGSGTLPYVVQAAASVWELAFNDTSFNHTVTITYSWAPLSGGTVGVHNLLTQGGSPHREISGMVRFDNDGSSQFFADGSLDPSNPINNGNSEYTTYTETTQNFGGGVMNKGRVFTGATGAAAGRLDLFWVAIHEIGHALGMSGSNTAYTTEAADGDVDVMAPFLYAGASLPTTGSHLNISTTLMFPFVAAGERRLPSAADIFANAQVSKFFNPNYNLNPIPEPAFAALGLVGLALLAQRRRRA
jgi:hypothetical protein